MSGAARVTAAVLLLKGATYILVSANLWFDARRGACAVPNAQVMRQEPWYVGQGGHCGVSTSAVMLLLQCYC